MLSEIGRSSRAYCEQAYRTEPVGADVVMALVDMGISLDGLQVSNTAETGVLKDRYAWSCVWITNYRVDIDELYDYQSLFI